MTEAFLEKLGPCERCGGKHLLVSRSSDFEIEVLGEGEPAYVTRARDRATDVTCANPACRAVVLSEDSLEDTDLDFIHDEI